MQKENEEPKKQKKEENGDGEVEEEEVDEDVDDEEEEIDGEGEDDDEEDIPEGEEDLDEGEGWYRRMRIVQAIEPEAQPLIAILSFFQMRKRTRKRV